MLASTKLVGGFFAGVCRLEDRSLTFGDPLFAADVPSACCHTTFLPGGVRWKYSLTALEVLLHPDEFLYLVDDREQNH
jgi:hypothetical protein